MKKFDVEITETLQRKVSVDVYKRQDHDAYMIFALYLVVMIAARVYL